MRVGHAVGHTLWKPDNLEQHVYEGWVRIREASQSTKGIWLIVLLFVRDSGGPLYRTLLAVGLTVREPCFSGPVCFGQGIRIES